MKKMTENTICLKRHFWNLQQLISKFANFLFPEVNIFSITLSLNTARPKFLHEQALKWHLCDCAELPFNRTDLGQVKLV